MQKRRWRDDGVEEDEDDRMTMRKVKSRMGGRGPQASVAAS